MIALLSGALSIGRLLPHIIGHRTGVKIGLVYSNLHMLNVIGTYVTMMVYSNESL